MEAAGPGKVAKWEQAEVVDVSIPTFVLAISIAFSAYSPLWVGSLTKLSTRLQLTISK